jgi:hypothetical protein
MEAELIVHLCKSLVVPSVVVLVGVMGAVRLVCSRGAMRQRLLSAVVVLCLAVSAAVSVLTIPTEMDGLRPGNPYPIGIGGLPERGEEQRMVPMLSF